MFSNIGNKLKGLAITLTVLGIISSLVYGIIVIVSTENLHGFVKASGVIGGLLIIVLGSILSWVGSLALYGFGQLVDSAQNIEKKLTGKTDEYYSSPQQEVDMAYNNVNKDNNTTVSVRQDSGNSQSVDAETPQRVGVIMTAQYNSESNHSLVGLFLKDDKLYCKACKTVVEPGDSICTGCRKRIDWTNIEE